MPSTRKQVRANRRNALKSTGPKSAPGKQISSRNATTHGLTGSDIIIRTSAFSEDPEDYSRLVTSLCEELKPASPLQEHLVRKIANCVWRSRRAVIAETAQISDDISDVEDDVYAQSRVKRCLTSLITEEDEGEPTEDEEDRKRQRLIRTRMIPSDSGSSSHRGLFVGQNPLRVLTIGARRCQDPKGVLTYKTSGARCRTREFVGQNPLRVLTVGARRRQDPEAGS